MQALVKTAGGAGHLELREVPVPQVVPDEVLIRVRNGSSLRSSAAQFVQHSSSLTSCRSMSGSVVLTSRAAVRL
jgi:NADPH:quinone reductase-like Zn-dependent oxidoreductase